MDAKKTQYYTSEVSNAFRTASVNFLFTSFFETADADAEEDFAAALAKYLEVNESMVRNKLKSECPRNALHFSAPTISKS